MKSTSNRNSVIITTITEARNYAENCGISEWQSGSSTEGYAKFLKVEHSFVSLRKQSDMHLCKYILSVGQDPASYSLSLHNVFIDELKLRMSEYWEGLKPENKKYANKSIEHVLGVDVSKGWDNIIDTKKTFGENIELIIEEMEVYYMEFSNQSEAVIKFEINLPNDFGSDSDAAAMLEDVGDLPYAETYEIIADIAKANGLMYVEETDFGAIWEGASSQFTACLESLPKWARGYASILDTACQSVESEAPARQLRR